MAQIEVLFREDANKVPFREKLGEIIEGEGNYLLITSGYFTSVHYDDENKTFFEEKFEKWISTNEEDKFFMDFYGGQKGKVKSDGTFDSNYLNFKRLAEYFRALGNKYCSKYNKKFQLRAGYSTELFHAKFSAKFDSYTINTTNKILLGSSNFTSKAFNICTEGDLFNFESDIYIKKEKNTDYDTTNIEMYKENDINNISLLKCSVEDKLLENIGNIFIKHIDKMREEKKFEMLDL